MLENELNRIFKHYKKKYKLKTKLYLEKNSDCAFDSKKNSILYDSNWLKHINLWRFDNTRPIREKLIFALLHEIKHAIDWECSKKIWEKEEEEINWILYFSNTIYQANLPIEKRAHKFAKKELKKWIKH